jgi:hypothetical protein
MKRLAPIILILALALLAPLSVHAQNPACNGLSEADCALLAGAQTNLMSITSATMPTVSIDFNLTTADETMHFTFDGSAGFMAAPGLEDLVIHVRVDNLVVQPQPEEPIPSSLELIITESMAYVYYEGEWYGEALTEEDLAELQSSLDEVNTSTAGMDLSTLGIDLTGVLTTTRGADAAVMGIPVATFTSNLDITALLTAVLGSPMVGQALGGGEEMTPEDMQMLGAMMAPLFTGTALKVDQWVGTQDGLFHKLVIDLAINLDLSMFDPETGKITGGALIDVEMVDINAGYSVDEPTSYRPSEELEWLQSGTGALEDVGGLGSSLFGG